MPDGSRSGYVVVANAAAGSSERSTIQRVAGRLAEAGPTSLAWTEGDDELDAVLAELDGRLLVVAGGDGTIHVVLNRLAATERLDQPVALVPAGTGNDLARGLGIGAEVDPAVEIVLTGEARWCAAIELSTGELAHNNAHFGLGLAAAERGAAWKPRLGRLAYPSGALVEGLRHPGEHLSLAVDGEVVYDGPALAALVMLGPSAGGGLELVDGVDVTAPVLDLVVVEPVASPVDRLRLAVAAVRGGLDERDDVARWAGSAVQVSSTGMLRGDVDGEISDWPSPLELRVRPRAWRVVSPRDQV